MDQIRQLDTHPHWKHLKSGKVYKLMGYGRWMGNPVTEAAMDMQDVIVARPQGYTALGDYNVYPGNYNLSGMATADAAIMQTTQTINHGDMLVVYQGDFYDQKDRAFARRYEDFFDGRFVKVDEKGNELVKPAAPIEAKKPAKPAEDKAS